MAIGLLLIILGLWVLVNGFNGNLTGLLVQPNATTAIDTTPVDQAVPIVTKDGG